MKIDFVGCGGLNLDYIYEVSSYDLLSDLGLCLMSGREFTIRREEVEKIKEKLDSIGTLKYLSGGGSSANTITILSHQGWKTAFIGICGNDKEGDIVLSSMKGVDVSVVKRSGKTAMCLIVLDNRRDRCIFLVPHSLEEDFVDENALNLLKNARCLHLTSLVYETGFRSQMELVEHLTPEQFLSFDPGELYSQRGIDFLFPILARTNFLFITSLELKLLLRDMATENHIDNMKLLYKIITENSNYYYFKNSALRLIVCKMGREGAILFDGKDFLSEPAKEVQVVDNTGAGDAFNAGFLSGVLSGLTLRDSLKRAINLASESLKDYGRAWLDS